MVFTFVVVCLRLTLRISMPRMNVPRLLLRFISVTALIMSRLRLLAAYAFRLLLHASVVSMFMMRLMLAIILLAC